MVAEGKPIKAIAAATQRHARPPSSSASSGCSSGSPRACQRRHGRCARPAAPAARGDRRAARSRARRCRGCCRPASPTGSARAARTVGETERLDVTVLMSDIRGYSTIAEHADPSLLAQQLNRHRAEMNRAILSVGRHGDAVRRRRRDGGVRRARSVRRPRRPGARRGRGAMHAAQRAVNVEWAADGLPAVRARHRPVDRRGRRRAARLGRAASSTRSSATPSTCASACSSSPPTARSCSASRRGSSSRPSPRPKHLGTQLVKGRDTPVRPHRSPPTRTTMRPMSESRLTVSASPS